MIDYHGWIAKKSAIAPRAGLTVHPSQLGSHLFPFQRDLTQWALKKGRAALFADTGLGKTVMQLEWARHVSPHGRVLILTPLGRLLDEIHRGDSPKPRILKRYDEAAQAKEDA